MRIAYIGNFAVATNTEHYIARAWERLGCTVTRFNESQCTSETMRNVITAERFDLCTFAKLRLADWPGWGEPLHGNLTAQFCRHLIARGVPAACWLFDLLEPASRPSLFLWGKIAAAGMTRLFVTDGYTAPHLGNASTLPQACPDDYREGRRLDEYACDVVFLGSLYGPRQQWYDTLSKSLVKCKLTVKHVSKVRGPDLSDVMASCRLAIGPDYPFCEGYASNRIYVVTGYGGLFAGPANESYRRDDWREEEHYLSLPDDVAAWPEMIAGWLSGPPSNLQSKGTAFCRTHKTYDHRCRKLLNELGLKIPRETPVKHFAASPR